MNGMMLIHHINWELIFGSSVLNGAEYDGSNLPEQKIEWPKNTWLQRRLAEARAKELNDGEKLA